MFCMKTVFNWQKFKERRQAMQDWEKKPEPDKYPGYISIGGYYRDNMMKAQAKTARDIHKAKYIVGCDYAHEPQDGYRVFRGVFNALAITAVAAVIGFLIWWLL